MRGLLRTRLFGVPMIIRTKPFMAGFVTAHSHQKVHIRLVGPGESSRLYQHKLSTLV